MRNYLIAGNWKMNCDPAEAAELINGIKEEKPEIGDAVEVLVCPPFTSIAYAADAIGDSSIMLGAQNMHVEDSGAFTGEVSAPMLAGAGCTHVIIGHSERREYNGETDESVNAKTRKALSSELIPVVCVGEKLDERKAGIHMNLVADQVKKAFADIPASEAADVVVAYEPVWAIGTGETASPEQAQEMHAHLRATLAELYDEETADQIRILYGGSMKPANADDLLQQPDVDGGLIGGASLKAADFAQIISAAEKLA
jgi:triosephosphate isomerase